MHLRAFQVGDDPLSIQFKIRASFEPAAYVWSFGDGQTSAVSAPSHTYADEGTYHVTLEARTPAGQAVTRTVEVTVPQGRIRSGGNPRLP
jgi:PKD repeat protein